MIIALNTPNNKKVTAIIKFCTHINEIPSLLTVVFKWYAALAKAVSGFIFTVTSTVAVVTDFIGG